MSNAPTCRNCLHATWVMSPSGKQIKQKTPGTCTHPALADSKQVTWPTDKAHRCPGFARKPPTPA